MKERRTKLLLTNDDGIDAPGIRALHKVLREDYEVLVVAPMYEKSGASCSLSLSSEMEVDPRRDSRGRTWGYAVDGTPADCVKFAMTAIDDFQPDAILSGINRGMNLGNSIFYSGTVAAAIEATLYGIHAMACSLACFGSADIHFDDAAAVVRRVIPWWLRQNSNGRLLWNLNIPNGRLEDLGPIRLTSHGTSFFEDEFELYRREGDRLFYRNIGSKMVACAMKEDADDRAVTSREISLTVLKLDLSAPLEDQDRRQMQAELDKLSPARQNS